MDGGDYRKARVEIFPYGLQRSSLLDYVVKRHVWFFSFIAGLLCTLGCRRRIIIIKELQISGSSSRCRCPKLFAGAIVAPNRDQIEVLLPNISQCNPRFVSWLVADELQCNSSVQCSSV